MKYERVKELRKEKKKNQTEVGNDLGVTQRAYSHYEAGDRDMSPEFLIALADYYNVSIDYILGRTDKRTWKK